MLQKIKVERTAHYYINKPKPPVKAILIALHGYAQTAEDFIIDFESLSSDGIMVIAPEALSKFYNKNREMVASWMTSRHREDEINDYKKYLKEVYQEVKSNQPGVKIALLGFSQGVSTLFRFMSLLNENDCIQIFACSGTIPPELESKDLVLSKFNINFYYGDQDGLFPLKKVDENLNKLKELNLSYRAIPFKGRHEVPTECLLDIKNWALNA